MQVRRVGQLTAEQVAAVLALAHAAGDADGADPLSEHVVAGLGGEDAVHLLAQDGDLPVGYVHLQAGEGELCVHPSRRRHGVGRSLVLAALDAVGPAPLRLWAHGDHPSANALALALHFGRVRSLRQLRRPLTDDLAAPELAEGVRLRPFHVGTDDDAWLAVNARAFAQLPDQGGWTAADLRERFAQPWFDPAGFLVAERVADGALLGFHWTKVHSGHLAPGRAGGHWHDPIGEVYVLGVDPAQHSRGLGAALTLAGLRHLREQGLDQVMLYVESTNAPAIRLYEKLGFAHWLTHVCFQHPHETSSSPAAVTASTR